MSSVCCVVISLIRVYIHFDLGCVLCCYRLVIIEIWTTERLIWQHRRRRVPTRNVMTQHVATQHQVGGCELVSLTKSLVLRTWDGFVFFGYFVLALLFVLESLGIFGSHSTNHRHILQSKLVSEAECTFFVSRTHKQNLCLSVCHFFAVC